MELTDELKKKIDNMSHEDMCSRWRFAPIGDPLFQDGPAFDYFEQRFKEFGGFTPEISKRIGW